MISIIAAIDQNNAIGFNNALLCHLPNDLKNFKRITLGHPVIMGRHTYESLPVKPLPGRKNIIISQSLTVLQDCIVAPDIETACGLCSASEECFVIGGAQIYRQMIKFARKLYITRIHYRFKADTYFPRIDPQEWQLQTSERHETDDKHRYAYSFEVHQK
jgi:dihydrofolate reductase